MLQNKQTMAESTAPLELVAPVINILRTILLASLCLKLIKSCVYFESRTKTQNTSKKPFDLAIKSHVDIARPWYFRQAWHRHDIATNHHNKFCTCGQSDLSNIDNVIRWSS